MLADRAHREIDDGSVDLRHQYRGAQNWQREAISRRPDDRRSERREISRIVAHRISSRNSREGKASERRAFVPRSLGVF
jgi:hypothetical protein